MQIEKDHGRIETRKVTVISDFEGMDVETISKWPGIKSIVMVESKRELYNKTEQEVRCFITSLLPTAREAAKRIRKHWSIENNLHWCLDVAFGEDRSQVRDRNAASNLAILNKMSLNILKKETSVKLGIKSKRKTAGWDEQYLAKVTIKGANQTLAIVLKSYGGNPVNGGH